MKSVIIQAETARVCVAAFYDCKNLETLKIEGAVCHLESHVFAGCEKLQSVFLPQDFKFLNCSAFQRCPLLQEIEIPDDIEDITGTFRNGLFGKDSADQKIIRCGKKNKIAKRYAKKNRLKVEIK